MQTNRKQALQGLLQLNVREWLLFQFLLLITEMRRVSLATEFKTLNKLDLRAEHRKSHKKINAKSFKFFFCLSFVLRRMERNTFLKRNY